jgi:glycosyltransferase A (GT-A) superfamily protein (DUF2064 family)
VLPQYHELSDDKLLQQLNQLASKAISELLHRTADARAAKKGAHQQQLMRQNLFGQRVATKLQQQAAQQQLQQAAWAAKETAMQLQVKDLQQQLETAAVEAASGAATGPKSNSGRQKQDLLAAQLVEAKRAIDSKVGSIDECSNQHYNYDMSCKLHVT